jgi:hypothetical protein
MVEIMAAMRSALVDLVEAGEPMVILVAEELVAVILEELVAIMTIIQDQVVEAVLIIMEPTK